MKPGGVPQQKSPRDLLWRSSTSIHVGDGPCHWSWLDNRNSFLGNYFCFQLWWQIRNKYSQRKTFPKHDAFWHKWDGILLHASCLSGRLSSGKWNSSKLSREHGKHNSQPALLSPLEHAMGPVSKPSRSKSMQEIGAFCWEALSFCITDKWVSPRQWVTQVLKTEKGLLGWRGAKKKGPLACCDVSLGPSICAWKPGWCTDAKLWNWTTFTCSVWGNQWG